MVWLKGTLRAYMQDALQALAQPAEIQLRLLPSFINPAPYLLYQFLLYFDEVVRSDNPFHKGTHSDNSQVSAAEETVLFYVRKAISHHFIRAINESVADGHSLVTRVFSLLYSDEFETMVYLLSREGLQSRSEWSAMRQIAKEVLFRLEWPMQLPSPAWQPSSVSLKGSYDYYLTREEGKFSAMIYEDHKVQIVPDNGNLLVEHSYCDDPYLGARWVHALTVAASEKAKMLALLQKKQDVPDTLLPPNALLLESIHQEFCTLQRLSNWLQKNSIPFSVRHE